MPTPTRLTVHGDDLQVPLIDGRLVRYVNLDYAASAPPLTAVTDAVAQLIPWYSSVHRGAGFASTVSTEVLEASRRTIGRFVGARPDDHVVFTRNTTDALNLLARALPRNTTVVHFDTEHHANLLPWRRHGIRSLGIPSTPAGAVEALERALSGRRTGTGAVLVTVTGASNVTGEILPVAELAAVARRHGARIALDAAQLAPHRRVDIDRLGVDYVALSGHKLYAPYGAGVLVGRSDWLDAAPPYLAGGGAVRRVDTSSTDWADGPARHEGGTPNLIGAYALATAARTLSAVGFDTVERHETELRRRLDAGLAEIPGLVRHGLWGPEADRIGVATFNLVGRTAVDVATDLSAQHGIGVRDGSFCAHPFVAALTYGRRVGPTATPTALRASFGIGSTTDDVDRLVDALGAIATSPLEHRPPDRAGGSGDTARVDRRVRPAFLADLLADLRDDDTPTVDDTIGAAPCAAVAS